MRGFHRAYTTGLACRHGTLTHKDTWSRPILGLAYVSLVETNPYLKLVVFYWLYTLWTSLGTFSTFLSNFRCKLLVMTGGSPVMIKGQCRLLAVLVKPFVGTMQASFWPIYSLKVVSKPNYWQTDGQTYRWTDKQTIDKVIPKWRSASLVPHLPICCV